MKKTVIITLSLIICAAFCGCGNKADAPAADAGIKETVEAAAEETIDSTAPETPKPIEVTVPTETPVPDEELLPDEPEEESAKTDEPEETAAADDNDISEKDTKETNVSGRTIVWLGDSLTQGSLGDDNDNLANAPYKKLQSLVSNKVEGYGLYGYKTHDIFWVYRDEGHYHQSIDPDKIYIFWVGSCDWCPDDGENTDTAPVIAEIDSFLASGPVKDYIVIGTTQRWRLGLERAKIINANLAAKYGSHYMDVIDIIAANGFSPDNTHLSQASYDAIAAAVCNKLKALGYI